MRTIQECAIPTNVNGCVHVEMPQGADVLDIVMKEDDTLVLVVIGDDNVPKVRKKFFLYHSNVEIKDNDSLNPFIGSFATQSGVLVHVSGGVHMVHEE